MAIKTQDDIERKIVELNKDKRKFEDFLCDVYNDEECADKVEKHLWRIEKQKEILEWVLDRGLPF